MKYIQIPGDYSVVIWQDEQGNSGVIRPTEPGWDDYQAWLTAGNTLEPASPADTRSIEELRASLAIAINAAADAALEPITSQYPRTEMDSWPEQCGEARAWLDDSSVRTPLLDAISGDVSAEEKKGLCLLILSKADEYKVAVGAVIAWRRVCMAWVETQGDRIRLLNFRPAYTEVPDAS